MNVDKKEKKMYYKQFLLSFYLLITFFFVSEFLRMMKQLFGFLQLLSLVERIPVIQKMMNESFGIP